VTRARRSHERVVLTEQGQPAAVLISVDDLDELQRFQDDSDIALCEAINARNEPGVPHDQFMAVSSAMLRSSRRTRCSSATSYPRLPVTPAAHSRCARVMCRSSSK
jgi:prevent-host-death family protein